MKVEDFTHVLPEDKITRSGAHKQLTGQIFDLVEANKAARHFREFREKVEEIEKAYRERKGVAPS